MSETEVMLEILENVSSIKLYLSMSGDYFAEVYPINGKFFFKNCLTYQGLLQDVLDSLRR